MVRPIEKSKGSKLLNRRQISTSYLSVFIVILEMKWKDTTVLTKKGIAKPAGLMLQHITMIQNEFLK